MFKRIVGRLLQVVASESKPEYQQTVSEYGPPTVDKDYSASSLPPTTVTTEPSKTFKDKFNGFVSSVSESVSGAAHKLDEKRKEAVAGTKKLVNGAIEKIKTTYDNLKHGDDSDEQQVPRDPNSSEEHEGHVKKTA